MTQPLVVCDWWKDPGRRFKLVPEKRIKHPPKPIELGFGSGVRYSRSLLAGLLQGGYEEVQPERIVRGEAQLQPYRPLEKYPDLALRFATVVRDTKSALEFVNTYGPLTEAGFKDGETVADILRHAATAKTLIGSAQRGDLFTVLGENGITMTAVKVEVVPGETAGKAIFQITANDLLTAICVQLGLYLCGDAKLKSCKRCAGPFLSGPGDGKLKADAVYCSVKCRTAANNDLKRERRLAKKGK